MSTETKTFETIQQLKAALPYLPDDAVIRDSDGDTVPRRDIAFMEGAYAPYTVTLYSPANVEVQEIRVGQPGDLREGDVVVKVPTWHTNADTGISGLIGDVVVRREVPAPEPEPELPIKSGSVVLDIDHDMRYFRANGLDYPWVSETGTWESNEYVSRLNWRAVEEAS